MKVFIAGPRAISALDPDVKERLSSIMLQGLTVLVGDACGVDQAVQKHLHKNAYQNVIVYASNGVARNNVGLWPVRNVAVEKGVSGFDFYVRKDAQMAADADFGFMIWNGKSKGTLNDMINLAKGGKGVLAYLTTRKEFYRFNRLDAVEKLTQACGDEAHALFRTLIGTASDLTVGPSALPCIEQLSLFNLSAANSGI